MRGPDKEGDDAALGLPTRKSGAGRVTYRAVDIYGGRQKELAMCCRPLILPDAINLDSN